jgi:sugar phosphate isomerase/epimerase
MITHGYPGINLADEFELAARIGASLLEILPNWSAAPSPDEVRRMASEQGLAIRSAHGCWGGQTIRTSRVDLGSTERSIHRESVDDLKRCIDWLDAAGGTYLVVHPGGLSHPDDLMSRREALMGSLSELAEYATDSEIIICVENMPPGVWPGSRMVDLYELLAEIDHPRLALALDTGHARLSGDPSGETIAAGSRLLTTHVHDNDGRRDQHLPPGEGVIDWRAWSRSLDEIDYRGPILLECIRTLRDDPARMNGRFFEILKVLTDAEISS